MASVTDEPPSPGPSDDSTHVIDNPRLEKTSQPDHSTIDSVEDICTDMDTNKTSLQKDLPPTEHPDGGQGKALGHQGAQTTGNKDVRVLYCTGVDFSLDYQELYAVFKQFGAVERGWGWLQAKSHLFVMSSFPRAVLQSQQEQN